MQSSWGQARTLAGLLRRVGGPLLGRPAGRRGPPAASGAPARGLVEPAAASGDLGPGPGGPSGRPEAPAAPAGAAGLRLTEACVAVRDRPPAPPSLPPPAPPGPLWPPQAR